MSFEDIASAIRDVPDFPKPGIRFKDITPVLQDPVLFRKAADLFVERHRDVGLDKLAVIESRGFLFGAAAAYRLGVGLALIRKKGKLPYRAYSTSYELEYGTAEIEMHVDAVGQGERVLILDDLLATGGTAAAAAELVEQAGGRVHEIDFLIELAFLHGRDKLSGYNVYAPIVF